MAVPPESRRPRGLYVHLPFCRAKCAYCDFNSRPATAEVVDRYLAALGRELAGLARTGSFLDTIYLGGGTPTFLGARRLEALLGRIGDCFHLLPGVEVTVEANPGAISLPLARRLRGMGVNRVSLGVQSFQDRFLRLLGRIHSARGARRAVDTLRRAGFDNVGIDLIYGLPGQGVSAWERDLGEAVSLQPEHCSLYALTLERGTPLARAVRAGVLPQPEEGAVADMYLLAVERTAAAGLGRYEISNFARAGRECRHNLRYWTMGEYLGAGAGAHSLLLAPRPVRRANVRSPDAYVGRLERGVPPVVRRERLSLARLRSEALWLGLRLEAGVSREGYRSRYGVDPAQAFAAALAPSEERGWLRITPERLALTGQGVLFANEVFWRLV
jgi:oxygen-independent coproporphyrinogen-3 oxidase